MNCAACPAIRERPAAKDVTIMGLCRVEGHADRQMEERRRGGRIRWRKRKEEEKNGRE